MRIHIPTFRRIRQIKQQSLARKLLQPDHLSQIRKSPSTHQDQLFFLHVLPTIAPSAHNGGDLQMRIGRVVGLHSGPELVVTSDNGDGIGPSGTAPTCSKQRCGSTGAKSKRTSAHKKSTTREASCGSTSDDIIAGLLG